MGERQLTPAQVAERIGYSTATLATWRCKGLGPRFVKYGDSKQARIRYKASEVERWIAGYGDHQNTGETAAA
ncbi:MAG: helix-turn-helix domain-containing protein [Caulobacter sp.]|nr:helix-turn-helix domain-containing protein [Caulobacter sp.]